MRGFPARYRICNVRAAGRNSRSTGCRAWLGQGGADLSPLLHLQGQEPRRLTAVGSNPDSATYWPCPLGPPVTAQSFGFAMGKKGAVLSPKGLACRINEGADTNKEINPG